MGHEREPARGVLVTPVIRLERQLGQGGMGSVWLAEHLKFQVPVVVKFIGRELLDHPEALARFEREAALAAQAKSPHVVQIYDHGVSELGLPYIAMELLEGEDLATRIARSGTVEPTLFAGWLRQACAGLGKAHARGIVHRDVKPENIFLCNEEGDILVKVLDFGIAKSTSTAGSFTGTRTGMMMGTAYYMSPEQTMGSKDVDYRTDLWALGVVAHLALTGRRAFDGDAIGAVVWSITSGPIAPPSKHNPALSPAIDAWMQRALCREPEGRFASAREMADAFSAAAGAENAATFRLDEGMPTAAAVLSVSSGDLDRGAGTQANFGRTQVDAPVVPLRRNPKTRVLAALGAIVVVGSLLAFVTWPGSDVAPETASPSTSEGPLVVATPNIESGQVKVEQQAMVQDPNQEPGQQEKVVTPLGASRAPFEATNVALSIRPTPVARPKASVTSSRAHAKPMTTSPASPAVPPPSPSVPVAPTKKNTSSGGEDLGGRL